MVTISPLELQAREKLNTFQPIFDSAPARMIAQVFVAMWSSSLPVQRVERIAFAMNGIPDGSMDLQPTLTYLTKAKVLRSRMISGQRHYEVNLDV